MANSAKKKNGDIFQKIFRCYKAVEIAVRKKKLFNIGPGYFPAKQVHWFWGVFKLPACYSSKSLGQQILFISLFRVAQMDLMTLMTGIYALF